MKIHKKIKSWIVDYAYMLRGGLLMVVHRNPPKHYLGYTVAGRAPVILIPGILSKWSFMKHLGDQISLRGHPVYVIPRLNYNIFNIPTSARMVKSAVLRIFPRNKRWRHKLSAGAGRIQALLEKHQLIGAVLVAHSKGGLIGKYFLSHYNEIGRVLGMVAVATPFSGSKLAELIPHDAFQELATDARIVKDLASHQEINKKIISIIPEYDNHVWAENGCVLAGAENITVPIHGHHKVLFDQGVVKLILRSIEKIVKSNPD